ncbi:MAG: PIN domain-containing protein [Planctomycetota bacterium]
MSLLVDTSVWSLAFRRDAPSRVPEVQALRQALQGEDLVLTTGIVLQEILQGFRGPRARQTILDHFARLPLLMPDREDHVEAALLRNRCRRRGIQIGTIDALLARLCIRHDLLMLSSDRDFARMAKAVPLAVWHA